MLFPSCRSTAFVFSLLASIFVTIVSIILIIFVFPDLISNELYKNLRLENGTEMYESFVNVPFPLTFKVYIFNVENPEDILNGKKPVLREIGPYVYKEYKTRVVEDVDDEEDTLSFRENLRFEFDQHASGNLSDKDNVTVLNIPMNNLFQTGEETIFKSLVYSCLPTIFRDLATPFITLKVKDFLFDGLKFCSKHSTLLCGIICDQAKRQPAIGTSEDGSLTVALFSPFRNRTNNTLFTVKRGFRDVHSLGEIVRVNNSKYTHAWERLGPGSSCDDVEGTYAFLYPPDISETASFKLYTFEFCRSIPAVFLEEKKFKGFRSFTFVPDDALFKSSFANKSEDCFCAERTPDVNRADSCYLDGVLDLQSCTGEPMLLSLPHFLDADPVYRKDVEGLAPDRERHRSFLTLEPETGVPLRASSRIQINIILRPYQSRAVKNLPRVVLPIFWADEECVLPDDHLDLLQTKYFNKVLMVHMVQWVLLGGGILSTVIHVGYWITRQYFYLPS